MKKKDIKENLVLKNEEIEKANTEKTENNQNEYLNNKRIRNENLSNLEINNESKDNNLCNTIENMDNNNINITRCIQCEKKTKSIKNSDEFFLFLNEEIFKYNFDKKYIENLKTLYDDIKINNLCEDCIIKEILIGGVNYLISKIKNNNDKIINSISQFFINSFIKRLDEVNELMIKNQIAQEELMNKMTLYLMIYNKNQIQEFNTNINECKNYLKNNREAYLKLYNSILEENEILKKVINKINNPINITNEKIEKFTNQMKEIINENISNSKDNNSQNNKTFLILNPFNNINDILANNIKNPFQKIPFSMSSLNNYNQLNVKNNINPLNSFDLSKDLKNSINNHNNTNILSNNLFPSLNQNVLLDYSSLNFNSNNILPPIHDSLNNNQILNDFKINSNFSDNNNSQLFNLPLNQFIQYFNMKNSIIPSPFIEQNKQIQNNFNPKLFSNINESNNLLYGFKDVLNTSNDLMQNFYDGNKRKNNNFEGKTGNLKNMFNELARQKDMKKVNNHNNTQNNQQKNNKQDNEKQN